METHKCQDMDHHLLDPIDPDSECRHSNMKSTNENSAKSSVSSTMDHNNNEQTHRHNQRGSAVTFQIRPKRKIRSFIRKLLGGTKFAKLHSSSLVSLFVILSFLLGYSKNANAMISKESKYGLTAYAEPCTDECKQRGFPYTWCHKKPSRNGTWIDRDYCSPGPGLTRYLEPCLESCHQDKRERSGSFFWCKTAPTSRGNWDYCSPYPRWGDQIHVHDFSNLIIFIYFIKIISMNMNLLFTNIFKKGMLVHGALGVVGQLAMPAVDLVQQLGPVDEE